MSHRMHNPEKREWRGRSYKRPKLDLRLRRAPTIQEQLEKGRTMTNTTPEYDLRIGDRVEVRRTAYTPWEGGEVKDFLSPHVAVVQTDAQPSLRLKLDLRMTRFCRKPPRNLRDIASEVRRDWSKVNFGAEPYLKAMEQMDRIEENFGADDGHGIVCYFLSNASSWRGPVAKRIKEELHLLLAQY